MRYVIKFRAHLYVRLANTSRTTTFMLQSVFGVYAGHTWMLPEFVWVTVFCINLRRNCVYLLRSFISSFLAEGFFPF